MKNDLTLAEVIVIIVATIALIIGTIYLEQNYPGTVSRMIIN